MVCEYTQNLSPGCPTKPDICNKTTVTKVCNENSECDVTLDLSGVKHNSSGFSCVNIDWGDTTIYDVTTSMNDPTHPKQFTHTYTLVSNTPEVKDIWLLVENDCGAQCTDCIKVLLTPKPESEIKIPTEYVIMGAGLLGLYMMLKK